VIVSLVGTDLDPQGLDAQRDALVAAGAEVHSSNAAATRRAVHLLSQSSKGASQ
jgi:FdrA protein